MLFVMRMKICEKLNEHKKSNSTVIASAQMFLSSILLRENDGGVMNIVETKRRKLNILTSENWAKVLFFLKKTKKKLVAKNRYECNSFRKTLNFIEN